MEQDLFIYLGLAFVIVLGCLYVWLRIKRLFSGFRKLKTDSDIRRLQKRSGVVRGLFSLYNWWKKFKQRRKNPDNLMKYLLRSGRLGTGQKIDPGRHRRQPSCVIKVGRTSLMLAAKKNRLEVVEFLLASGADVNLVGGGSGKSALIQGRRVWKHRNYKGMLVDHGSNLDIRSKISGKTALMKAAESGFLEIAIRLVRKDADVHLFNRTVTRLFHWR